MHVSTYIIRNIPHYGIEVAFNMTFRSSGKKGHKLAAMAFLYFNKAMDVPARVTWRCVLLSHERHHHLQENDASDWHVLSDFYQGDRRKKTI